jgi:hypothetical protein
MDGHKRRHVRQHPLPSGYPPVTEEEGLGIMLTLAVSALAWSIIFRLIF